MNPAWWLLIPGEMTLICCGAYAYGYLEGRRHSRTPSYTPVQTQTQTRKTMTTTYTLSLCDPDGTLMAVVPNSPIVPRFMHVTADGVHLSDAPDPDDDDAAAHVTTFARVASAVWVDDDKCALYVRVVR